MQRYAVIKEHISNYPDFIILSKAEVVIYGKEDTQFPNWIFCTSIATKKEGWVPKQILTTPNNNNIAIVTKDYSVHEITANEGDLLLGLEHLNDWTYCKTENDDYGWIPTYCLSEL